MSDYIASRVEKQRFFGLRPLVQGRGKRTPYIIGYDTEAENGRPFAIQFNIPGQGPDDSFIVTVPEEPHAAFRIFLHFIEEYCTNKNCEYLIYGHNIQYEFTQLFHDVDERMRMQGEWTFPVTSSRTNVDWDVRVYNDKRYFATFTNLNTHRQVRLLDSYAMFKTSLANMAEMLELDIGKYESEGIDRSHFTRADLTNPEFLKYASRDAYISRRAGEFIIGMHEDYDVSTCISAPHFASKVFKRHFLTGEIKLPNEQLEQYGLWSYHGGKNGLYVPDPIQLPAYQYDITSAYPEAMRQLPDPVHAEWETVSEYEPGQHAIYRATMTYNRCTYRGLLNINGSWPDTGYIEDAYVTSYELDEMVRRDEVSIKTIDGWRMVGPSGGSLVRYVDEFFGMKSRTTGPQRETAKLFLNSLYGKFFQKMPLGIVGALSIPDFDKPETWHFITTDPDLLYDWRAGGLYHPPIASLITGFVRGKIHALEHKYGSLMTSTDGIFATVPPDDNDLGKHLGGLTVQHGDLKLWRERLYIFRPDDGTKPKAAFHGFRGDMAALDAIPLRHGTYTYEGQQMVTLKLSTRALAGRQYEPGQFATMPYDITI